MLIAAAGLYLRAQISVHNNFVSELIFIVKIIFVFVVDDFFFHRLMRPREKQSLKYWAVTALILAD